MQCKKRECSEDKRRLMVISLLRVIEIHEHSIHTARHSDRVATVSYLMGKTIGLPERELGQLWRAALLHDIGKVGISSDIIFSDKKLSRRERGLIEMHPTYAKTILSAAPFFNIEALVASQHHECWDGSGYPSQIEKRDIHLYARIIHIVDVYDALVAFRGYKKLWDEKKAANFVFAQSGKMFDPTLVKTFLQVIETERFRGLYNDPEVYSVYKEMIK